MTKNQKKIKSLEKTIEFFPNIDYFKKQLVLYKWADLLDIEINGSYYPRFKDENYDKLFVNANCISSIDKEEKYTLCFYLYEDSIVEKFKNLKYEAYIPYGFCSCSGIFVFDLENGKKALKVYNDFISELEKEKK